METERLQLYEYDNHRKLLLYFNKSITVPAGIGVKSKAYLVVASDAIKVHIKNAKLVVNEPLELDDADFRDLYSFIENDKDLFNFAKIQLLDVMDLAKDKDK